MPTELTVKALDAAKPGDMLFDAIVKGLIFKAGRRDRLWVLQLRFPGCKVQSKRTLGKYPGMGLAEARTKASEWRQLVERGKDPAAVAAEAAAAVEKARLDAERAEQEAKAKAEREAKNTFRALAEAYIAARTNRRAHKDALAIRRDLIAPWGDKPVSAITPRDVKAVIGDLAKRTPHGAREAWGHAVLIFKQAVHDELIEASPLASLDKKLVLNGARFDPRDRMLSEDELVALWLAAVARKYPEGVAVQWLMLSGARLGEALGARWREFHPELRQWLRDKDKARRPAIAKRVWTVPGERTGNKSGKPRDVPITDAMLDLLASVPVRDLDDHVFSHTGEHQLGSLSKLKVWLDEHIAGTLADRAAKRGETYDTLPPFVLHDLRHTLRTALAGLGVDDVVAEMVIGHGKRGIQRVYDHSKRLPEIRAALDKWAAYLAAVVARARDDKVKVLR
jgi:integrase